VNSMIYTDSIAADSTLGRRFSDLWVANGSLIYALI